MPFLEAGRQLLSDSGRIALRSAALAVPVTLANIPHHPDTVNTVLFNGVAAGAASRLVREMQNRLHQSGNDCLSGRQSALESFLVTVNAVAFPLLLNLQISLAEQAIVATCFIGAELLLLYASREDQNPSPNQD